MNFCNQCGAALPEGAEFCPSCHRPVEPPISADAPTPPADAPADPSIVPAAPDASPDGPVPPFHTQEESADTSAPATPYYGAPEAPVPESEMTTGQYFWALILFGLPLIGFIMTLIWGFGSGSCAARKRLARASLIKKLVYNSVLGILIALVVMAVSALVAFGNFNFDGYYGGYGDYGNYGSYGDYGQGSYHHTSVGDVSFSNLEAQGFSGC